MAENGIDPGTAGGTPPAGGLPNGGAPPDGGAPPAPSGDWMDTVGDDLKPWLQSKGLKNPADVAKSYRNLEVLFGAEKAGRAVVLPKDDATPEEREQFYAKLGRPEAPDKYELPIDPEIDPEFCKSLADLSFKYGLNKQQAGGFATDLQALVKSAAEAGEQEQAQRNEQQTAELRSLWGPQFDQRQEMARRAGRQFGLDDAKLQTLTNALGPKDAALFLESIGKSLGEAAPPGAGHQSFTPTPQEAQQAIEQLKQDPQFRQALTEKKAEAVDKWNKLWAAASAL
jgi:hypothetical protein